MMEIREYYKTEEEANQAMAACLERYHPAAYMTEVRVIFSEDHGLWLLTGKRLKTLG